VVEELLLALRDRAHLHRCPPDLKADWASPAWRRRMGWEGGLVWAALLRLQQPVSAAARWRRTFAELQHLHTRRRDQDAAMLTELCAMHAPARSCLH
jgi:hypothetical protein